MITNEFSESMECRRNMLHTARVWGMTRDISKMLNEHDITYDEFLEIFDNIAHFAHHEAELLQRQNEYRYKNDNDISFNEELNYSKIDDDDLEWIIVDIDDVDGEWFIIPEIE